MKRNVITLACALGVFMPVLAQDPPHTPFASVKEHKTVVHVVKPLAPANAEKTKIERVGNVSSRPWTQIVGWNQGTQFASDAERYHEPRFNLFWLGNEPQ